MLNTLQLIAYMPLFDQLVEPIVAQLFNQRLLNFATFSWIPTDFINSSIYHLEKQPEDEAGSKFALYDYKSDLFIENMGFNLLMQAFYVALVIFRMLIPCCMTLRKKLASHLFWNGPIRLFMELYIEMVLLSLLNLLNLDWGGAGQE